MGGLSWWHWVIIVAAFILIFGARKLPDAARGVGKSLRILKSEVAAMHEDGEKSESADGAATTATQPQTPSQIPPAEPLTSPAAPAAPPVQQPVAAPAQPAAAPAAAAAEQQTAVPVINGVPVSEDTSK